MGDKNKVKRAVKRERREKEKARKNEEEMKIKQMEEDEFFEAVETFTNGFRMPLSSYELKQALGQRTSSKFTKIEHWERYMDIVLKIEKMSKELRKQKKDDATRTGETNLEDESLDELLAVGNLNPTERKIVERRLERIKKIDEETR